MIPSTGGELPPDPLLSPHNPAVSNLASESISRRTSTRSGANKKSEDVEGGHGKSAAGAQIPVIKGSLKSSKAGKSRQPLANLNVQELTRGESLFNSLDQEIPNPLLQNTPNRIRVESMEEEPTVTVALDASAQTVPLDAAVMAINQPVQNIQGLATPSKSPCTLNAEPVSVPTPVKLIDFDMVDDTVGDIQNGVVDEGVRDGGYGNGSTGQGDKPNSVDEGNPDVPRFNAWTNSLNRGLTIAERIHNSKLANRVRIEYFPPMITPEGKCRVIVSQEDLVKSAKAYSLHLYGYFLGTSMDFNRVNFCLKRDWKNYDLAEVTKSPAGFFYFKFRSEKGLNDVLEGGPWFVNNIPLCVKKWEPGLCLEKTEPATIPLWVTAHDVPLELWTDTGICKIMSGTGFPLLMDRVTEARCANQSGKMGYARMLVDVQANLNLPSEVEVEFPATSNRPDRIGKVKVDYHWKPPVCHHCAVFGHSFKLCKTRPRTDEELLVQTQKLQLGADGKAENANKCEKVEEYTVVRRKNKGNKGNKTGSTNVTGQGGQGQKNSANNTNINNKGKGKDTGASTSSDPIVQRKMGVLHASYIEENQVQQVNQKRNETKCNIRRVVVREQTLVNPVSSPKKKKPMLSKNSSAHPISNSTHIPTSNTFYVLNDLSADLLMKGQDLSEHTVKETGDHSNGMDLSEESSDESVDELVESDADEEDICISDGQKKAIRDKLISDGCVSARVQDGWDQGEWAYFHLQCRNLQLDPTYAVEDVCPDTSGTAKFITKQANLERKSTTVSLSNVPNQNALMQHLAGDRYSICGAIETHLSQSKIAATCQRVFGNWLWESNASVCQNGYRIIVSWDPHSVNLMVVERHPQVLHCFVEPVNGSLGFYCSIFYAHHRMVPRRECWYSLNMHKLAVQDHPWVLLGDFNAIIDPCERSAGSSFINSSMSEARDCFNNIEVEDLCMSGLKFTWNQSPGKPDGLLKKLDRAMSNHSFISTFPLAHAHFLPFLKSDHSPIVISLPEVNNPKPKPFRFPNYLTRKEKFLPVVTESWAKPVSGCSMYCLVTRLKTLKKEIRKLNFEQGNLFANVKKLKAELESIQNDIVTDPENCDLRDVEACFLNAYKIAVRDEELFLQQKAKAFWLKEGDHNSKFFHRMVKSNQNRNRIHMIEDVNGTVHSGNAVADQFVSHFKSVLGVAANTTPIHDPSSLFSKCVSPDDAQSMVQDVTDDEIKTALFGIEDCKAPGPDGYSAKFFKSAWNVVGKDVCLAVKGFFRNGKLLKEVNATVIALVPKTETPRKVTDFRPIACCNVIYKCISKIIADRIKNSLKYIVNDNQCAFIPERQISDNILLTQELMRNYHRNRGEARCASKIDIQKAYDTVEWEFLKVCLVHFGFPLKMINWIMACVTSTSFSIAVNGDHHGFFEGNRGLRQGDPMSPYLFTLVMEVLTLMISRRVRQNDSFQYHWRCKDVGLTHLCFADDLLLFCHGDASSVFTLMDALDEFKHVSGLVPSIPKSTIYFGNVDLNVRETIENYIQFRVGELPVRYLGVPLLSTSLRKKDCTPLIDKVKKRLQDWKNKSLSFAGRLQLISSVLNSIQVFWSSVFILPISVSKEIEKLMRGFLWCHGVLQRGKAKVKWKEVCVPMCQGGLGLKLLRTWNIALISKHVWNVITRKESLWVKWIYSYRIKNNNFWDLECKADACWSWRKIMECRAALRAHIIHILGDGKSTSAWFDN
ncbi:putative RNA-directed DNA polymerase [Helianthus anomalus]